MGIAIGHHDEKSNRMRYLRDDSTEDIQWSTVDPMRAKVWHSAAHAQAWVYRLPIESYRRVMSAGRAFYEVAREAEVLDDIPCDEAWLDDPSASVSMRQHDDCLESARREHRRREAKGVKR